MCVCKVKFFPTNELELFDAPISDQRQELVTEVRVSRAGPGDGLQAGRAPQHGRLHGHRSRDLREPHHRSNQGKTFVLAFLGKDLIFL